MADALELTRRLAPAEEVRDCVARQWLRFALGRELDETEDASTLTSVMKTRQRQRRQDHRHARRGRPVQRFPPSEGEAMKLLRTITLGKTNPTRRQLLKALGLSAAAYPLMPTLNGWAQEGAQPLRLLLTFTSSGVVPEQWYPTGSETDLDLPGRRHHRAVQQAQGRHDLLQGPQARRGRRRRPRGVDRRRLDRQLLHQQRRPRPPRSTRSSPRSSPSRPTSSPTSSGSTASTRARGTSPRSARTTTRTSSTPGPNQKIESQCDPYKVFDQLFAGVSMGGVGDTMNMDRLRAERRSILDALKGDFADLNTKVAREDKLKIGSHLESVREIERRLDSGGPRMMGAIARPAGRHRPRSHGQLRAAHPHHEPAGGGGAGLGPHPHRLAAVVAGLQPDPAHLGGGPRGAPHPSRTREGEKVMLAKIQGWYAKRYSDLFDLMKAVPEGNGTLLDNTLIAYSNELALGWTHGVDPAATYWVTGAKGRFGGKLKSSGRFLDYSDQFDYNQMLQTMCPPHGRHHRNKVGDFGKPGIIAPLLA